MCSSDLLFISGLKQTRSSFVPERVQPQCTIEETNYKWIVKSLCAKTVNADYCAASGLGSPLN